MCKRKYVVTVISLKDRNLRFDVWVIGKEDGSMKLREGLMKARMCLTEFRIWLTKSKICVIILCKYLLNVIPCQICC